MLVTARGGELETAFDVSVILPLTLNSTDVSHYSISLDGVGVHEAQLLADAQQLVEVGCVHILTNGIDAVGIEAWVNSIHALLVLWQMVSQLHEHLRLHLY